MQETIPDKRKCNRTPGLLLPVFPSSASLTSLISASSHLTMSNVPMSNASDWAKIPSILNFFTKPIISCGFLRGITGRLCSLPLCTSSIWSCLLPYLMPLLCFRFWNDGLWETLNWFLLVYIDDIIIFSESQGKHVQHICLVQQRSAPPPHPKILSPCHHLPHVCSREVAYQTVSRSSQSPFYSLLPKAGTLFLF